MVLKYFFVFYRRLVKNAAFEKFRYKVELGQDPKIHLPVMLDKVVWQD